MKTRRLLVTRAHRYGTRELKAGDEYEAPALEAAVAVATKKARYAPKASSAPEPVVSASVPAEPTTAPVSSPLEPAPLDVSHETEDEPNGDEPPEAPKRRGRPPIHGRYSRRDT